MSHPRCIWWEYAKNMIRQYPELKKEHDLLHNQKITNEVGLIRGKGNLTRRTENTALKSLPRVKQKEYDAVAQAIERTKLLETGAERLELVKMVLMKQITNIAGASMRLNISEVTGKRWHGDFIHLVGFCYGLEDEQND